MPYATPRKPKGSVGGMVPAGGTRATLYNGLRSRTKARTDCPLCKRPDRGSRRYLYRRGWVCESCFSQRMQEVSITAAEVQPGDIAFEMVVTDIGDKGGRPKLFGVGLEAESTRTDSRKATTRDPAEMVTVQRPQFKYRPRSLF